MAIRAVMTGEVLKTSAGFRDIFGYVPGLREIRVG
jgi:hypothetical protein